MPFLLTVSEYKLARLNAPGVDLSSRKMSVSRAEVPASSLKNSTVRAPQSTRVAFVMRLLMSQIWSI